MAYAAAKGLAIRDCLASSFVHQYFDLKLYAELGATFDLDSLNCYEIEAFHHVLAGLNRFYKEQSDAAKKRSR